MRTAQEEPWLGGDLQLACLWALSVPSPPAHQERIKGHRAAASLGVGPSQPVNRRKPRCRQVSTFAVCCRVLLPEPEARPKPPRPPPRPSWVSPSHLENVGAAQSAGRCARVFTSARGPRRANSKQAGICTDVNNL